jgi:hypothetical protein
VALKTEHKEIAQSLLEMKEENVRLRGDNQQLESDAKDLNAAHVASQEQLQNQEMIIDDQANKIVKFERVVCQLTLLNIQLQVEVNAPQHRNSTNSIKVQRKTHKGRLEDEQHCSTPNAEKKVVCTKEDIPEEMMGDRFVERAQVHTTKTEENMNNEKSRLHIREQSYDGDLMSVAVDDSFHQEEIVEDQNHVNKGSLYGSREFLVQQSSCYWFVVHTAITCASYDKAEHHHLPDLKRLLALLKRYVKWMSFTPC